jgi:hypothetical protein
MKNNEVIKLGVNKVNDDRKASVVGKATTLIVTIEQEQAMIASRVADNAKSVEDLKKLETVDVTYASVTGSPAPATPNVNQAAIVAALDALQKKRSEAVAAKAQAISETIASRLALIADGQKRIADFRKQLSELELEVVTETAIVG